MKKKPELLPLPNFGRLMQTNCPWDEVWVQAWPIIDGYVIPDDQYKLYEEGKYNDVPVLIGYNSDEGASFSRAKTPEEYIASVENRFGKFADTLLKVYPVGKNNVPKSARDLMP